MRAHGEGNRTLLPPSKRKERWIRLVVRRTRLTSPNTVVWRLAAGQKLSKKSLTVGELPAYRVRVSQQPADQVQAAGADSELSRLRVLAHPLRLRMLSLLTGAAFSAMELSRELGISQALASYHLRQLHAAGVVELTEVRTRRGGRERRFTYSTAATTSAGIGDRDLEGYALLAEAFAVELRRRSQYADPGATGLGVDAELWVDPAVWSSTIEAVRAATTELHERACPPRTAGTTRVSVSALLFSMVEPPPDDDG